ncbi:hypothetical protein WUBG_08877 [Wuchereria bancrofti]|uniref:Uncharacterized protein n=1 Tax=Wuchereria bancrofti TaxID=6293 RepID=J9EYI5_WUCBA|nr:hypothetical protein WUBG_08877 [Wuchereria bancrofti]VDM09002.1 unnamed protein product [Wuchereria bancrofti]
MSKMDADVQTPLNLVTPPPPPPPPDRSDVVAQEQRLGFQQWVNLTFGRECTPILYVYFAGIAILGVITVGIIVIVGLRCNWHFVAAELKLKNCEFFRVRREK